MKMLPGIGVFGTDPVVKTIVPFLQAKGFRVEALWGLTLQDAQNTAKELSIPFWTNKVDDVLLRKDVELVFVLCPPNLHSQIAVKALGIGKHVLCDRPAGLSQCEALKMVLAAQYYPSLICVLNHGLRFHPAFVHMKRNIDKFVGQPKLCQCRIEMGPILGQTFNWLCDDVMGLLHSFSTSLKTAWLEWNCGLLTGGGNVTLFGSHLIDLITYLTGLRAQRVHGVTRTLTSSTMSINGTRRITSPDFAVIQMEMESGMLVSITLTNHMEKGYFCQEVLLCGSKGYLKADGVKIKGLIHSNHFVPPSVGNSTNNNNSSSTQKATAIGGSPPAENKEVIVYEDSEDGDLMLMERAATKRETSPLLPAIYMTGLLKLVGALREAFNTPSNGEEWKRETTVGILGAGFEEGLYIQAVIEAIRRSSKENCWVKVNIITEEPDPNPVLTAAVRTSTISM